MTCRMILVEDHATMRQTLSQFVSGLSDILLVGDVESGEEMLRTCAELKPEIALIDVSLPGMSGIDLVGELRFRHPEIACLMLSGHQEINYVQRALAHGARGYVLKGDPSELLEAIQQVIAGEIYLSQSIRDKLTAMKHNDFSDPTRTRPG